MNVIQNRKIIRYIESATKITTQMLENVNRLINNDNA
jgi:hypothetical protein